MSLVNWMIRSSLGANPTSVALFLGDREVAGGGYRRVPVRWKVDGTRAEATVAFGPYTEPVSYDRYVVFAGDERLEAVQETASATMPTGFRWEWRTSVAIGQGG